MSEYVDTEPLVSALKGRVGQSLKNSGSDSWTVY
jgi:hypothetical protein